MNLNLKKNTEKKHHRKLFHLCFGVVEVFADQLQIQHCHNFPNNEVEHLRVLKVPRLQLLHEFDGDFDFSPVMALRPQNHGLIKKKRS